MSDSEKETGKHSRTEKALAPLAFLTGIPTNPLATPLLSNAPEGLAFVCAASTAAEADLIRQMLRDAGFAVEHVAASATGVFGTTGNANVYVHTDEEKEAREFLSQLLEKNAGERNPEE